jgi:hypothetical protein
MKPVKFWFVSCVQELFQNYKTVQLISKEFFDELHHEQLPVPPHQKVPPPPPPPAAVSHGLWLYSYLENQLVISCTFAGIHVRSSLAI